MRLADILAKNGEQEISKLFDETKPAGDFGPLPPGEYVAHIVDGELFKSLTNDTPGFKMKFKVVEGEYTDRLFWHDCWLTPKAMPHSKRDLQKIGVVSLEQLEKPLPRFFRCKCKLALRQDEDGKERNRLKSFEVVGIDSPKVDPFAPVVAVSKPDEPTPTLPAVAASQPDSEGTACDPS